MVFAQMIVDTFIEFICGRFLCRVRRKRVRPCMAEEACSVLCCQKMLPTNKQNTFEKERCTNESVRSC